MSRPFVRLTSVVTFGFCVVGVACTSSEPVAADGSAATANNAADAAPAHVDPGPRVEPGQPVADSSTPDPASGEAGEAGEVEAVAGEPGPVAPEGYGLLRFPTPPASAEELTLYGLAGYEIVAVYAEPNKDSAHLGFMRIGTRLRVGNKTVTEDCRKGWYALEGGGWACASRGLVVDTREPFMAYQPSAARLDQPFPYDWAYVREWNTPMWWQVPSAEALAATREKRAILEAERTGEPLPGSEPAGTGDASATTGGGGVESGDDGADPGEVGVEDGGDDGATPTPPTPPPPTPTPPTPAEPEPEKEPVKIPLSPATPWLEKGYFLSLGETVREGSTSYWRTARGGVVEKSRAFPYEAKDYQGAEIHPGMSFPVGFVMAKNGTKLLELGADDKLHARGKTLDKRTFLNLGEEVEVGGQAYFTVLPYPPPDTPETPPEAGEAGEAETPEPLMLVKADLMRLPDLQPLPKGLDPWDRWIDVDITKQILVAYEGTTPVYVTLVSTGKKGSAEEPFDTPPGRYRIYSKQVTSNMDGATATDGNYAIQDVPWVMYFEGSYALHGAFWHTSFGYVRSHGCVNLGPSDARWLFLWTTPFVPERWHGVTAGEDNPGSTVIIRES